MTSERNAEGRAQESTKWKFLSSCPVGSGHILFLASACGHLHVALPTREALLSLGIVFVLGLSDPGRVDGLFDWLIDYPCVDLNLGRLRLCDLKSPL